MSAPAKVPKVIMTRVMSVHTHTQINALWVYAQNTTDTLVSVRAERDALKAVSDARKAKIDARKAKIDARKAKIDTRKARKAMRAAYKGRKVMLAACKAKRDARKAKRDARKAERDANAPTEPINEGGDMEQDLSGFDAPMPDQAPQAIAGGAGPLKADQADDDDEMMVAGGGPGAGVLKTDQAEGEACLKTDESQPVDHDDADDSTVSEDLPATLPIDGDMEQDLTGF
jgi:hypothetical protein